MTKIWTPIGTKRNEPRAGKDKKTRTRGNTACLLGDKRWQFVHGNFRYLSNFLDYYGVTQIDGLLADLGVSFHHFDEAERGFSFRFAGPLDMRMNQAAGKTAADLINSYSEEELAKVLYLYGEMRNARQVAKAIVREREKMRYCAQSNWSAACCAKNRK